MRTPKERFESFLVEYQEIVSKHGITIHSCGCEGVYCIDLITEDGENFLHGLEEMTVDYLRKVGI